MTRARQAAFAVMWLFLGANGNAVAGPRAYICAVKHVYGLKSDGSLGASLEKSLLGKNFTVSRETGEITGQALTTALAMSFHVVEKGSARNAFRAMAEFGDSFRFGDGTHAYQLLDVQEFREGNAKPFVASSMGGAGIVTGVCR